MSIDVYFLRAGGEFPERVQPCATEVSSLGWLAEGELHVFSEGEKREDDATPETTEEMMPFEEWDSPEARCACYACQARKTPRHSRRWPLL